MRRPSRGSRRRHARAPTLPCGRRPPGSPSGAPGPSRPSVADGSPPSACTVRRHGHPGRGHRRRARGAPRWRRWRPATRRRCCGPGAPSWPSRSTRSTSNGDYLAGLPAAHGLRATADLEEAVRQADVLVMGVPSLGFRGVLEEVSEPTCGRGCRSSQPDQGPRARHPAADERDRHRGAARATRSGVLTGPNLAKEILAGHAAASVIAMDDDNVAQASSRSSSRPTCSASTPTRTSSAASWAACSRTSSPSPRAWPTASAPATTPGPRSSPAACRR